MKESIQKRTIRRLKIIEGQIRGIQKMLENKAYCIDILYQSSAVKQALSSVEDIILEQHLKTHVVEQIKSGEGSKSTKEILEIYKLSKKK